MTAYWVALAELWGVALVPDKNPVPREDTFDWLFAQYFRSAAFLKLDRQTQKDKHSVLGRFAKTADGLSYEVSPGGHGKEPAGAQHYAWRRRQAGEGASGTLQLGARAEAALGELKSHDRGGIPSTRRRLASIRGLWARSISFEPIGRSAPCHALRWRL